MNEPDGLRGPILRHREADRQGIAGPLPANLEWQIREARGVKVLLDEDLAALYGVGVKVLNQAVRRNAPRFPEDFMFRLTAPEHAALRSQSVTLDSGRGRHRKYLPYAFTEQGVAMLSSVLRSERAIQVNVEIIRAFVRLRAMMIGHAELSRRLLALEATYDEQFRVVFEAIRDLMAPPPTSKRAPIGFVPSGGSRGRFAASPVPVKRT